MLNEITQNSYLLKSNAVMTWSNLENTGAFRVAACRSVCRIKVKERKYTKLSQ